jgi:TetR/AcrR family transcriptional regulator, multidrug resistance operon repressor
LRTRNTVKVELVKQKAIELLVKDGFEGFSVNNLAKACAISVATLYIYYKDKDDLIIKIGSEEMKKMTSAIFEDFDPEASFEDGMRVQWRNRYKYMIKNPKTAAFLEQLRSSTYQKNIFKSSIDEFTNMMGRFFHNALSNGEIDEFPVGVFWSVAFAPLYSLIRFNSEGSSVGGKPFKITDKLVWQTFDLVMKALKK